MSKKQELIIKFISDKGKVKKSEIVKEFGFWYHSNDSFHIGNILSRMVKSKLITRISKGYYKICDEDKNIDQLKIF